MGFFRRYKLTDYTAKECRTKMDEAIECALLENQYAMMVDWMEEWACFRELLARHDGWNGTRCPQCQRPVSYGSEHARGSERSPNWVC